MQLYQKRIIFYKDLKPGRWPAFSFMEQLVNIGMDIERSIRWKKGGELGKSIEAFEAALELLTFTKEDPKNKEQLSELCRIHEQLIDHFVDGNKYNTTEEYWSNYFYDCNYRAALERGK